MELVDLIPLLCFAAVILCLWLWNWPATKGREKNLPPSPPGWPIVGNLIQVILHKKHFVFQIPDLRARYGPIFSLKMGQKILIVITSSELIHEALFQRGTLFASRPHNSPMRFAFSGGKCAIHTTEYGQRWRTLRQNLQSGLTNPIRAKQSSWIRDFAIENHLNRLKKESIRWDFVEVMSNVRLALCEILICMCFGAKISEEKIKEIDNVQKVLVSVTNNKLPDFMPKVMPFFPRQIKAAKELRARQMELMAPLLRNRRAFVEDGNSSDTSSGIVSPIGTAYVDSLFRLDLEQGPLEEEEIVSLCSELLAGGTDTTVAALEWAFYHLMLNQGIQEKLYQEIVATVGEKGSVTEDDVGNMPYLSAVVKETFRRTPPSYFLVSHKTLNDTELGGYTIPADATVEFYVKWVTEDPVLWEDPAEFRPERFLSGDGIDVDLTGKQRVKMLPFGVGRRACPAGTLGTLHIHLLIARMVHAYKWIPVPGAPPDPTEAFALSIVMKDPLKAVIVPRS